MRPEASAHYEQDWIDRLCIAGVLLFLLLLTLFPLRNNDIWWHMAVGKEILRTGRFITADPFSFTLPGHPWVPQSYIAGIIFYLVHAAGSVPALIALRALMVVSLFLVLIRIISRAGISLALASPVLLLAVLTINTRFIIRPHLFEYLFIAVLLWWLYADRHHGRYRFYLVPFLLQVLWVNMHPSYFLGPVIVLLFMLGEGSARLLSDRLGFVRSGIRRTFAWKPALLLLLLVAGACFINPDPAGFLGQPLDAGQRELLTQYTLEWRSPFESALREAPFHPYYELLLVMACLAFVAGAPRLHLASLLLTGMFMVLSLLAHRFRFEFAVVALPLLLLQLRDAPVVRRALALLSAPHSRAVMSRALFAGIACGVLIFAGSSRIAIGGSTADRYPVEAFAFLRSEGIGHRSFHSIGFGSFLIWDLYQERKTFIDGRNISPELHRDFLTCQTDRSGFEKISKKYALDTFVIPAPEASDGGMLNLHRFLTDAPTWQLVYCDRHACVYASSKAHAADWLLKHAFRIYHPLTFGPSQVRTAAEPVLAELKRATGLDPLYFKPWADLGTALVQLDRPVEAMDAFDHALALTPDRHRIWHNKGIAAARAGRYDEAAAAFERELLLMPDRIDAHLALAQVYRHLQRPAEAEREVSKALRIDPHNREAARMLRELRGSRQNH